MLKPDRHLTIGHLDTKSLLQIYSTQFCHEISIYPHVRNMAVVFFFLLPALEMMQLSHSFAFIMYGRFM